MMEEGQGYLAQHGKTIIKPANKTVQDTPYGFYHSGFFKCAAAVNRR